MKTGTIILLIYLIVVMLYVIVRQNKKLFKKEYFWDNIATLLFSFVAPMLYLFVMIIELFNKISGGMSDGIS